MALQMICPNLLCRKFLTVPDESRGKTVQCEHCKQKFRIPESKPAGSPVKGAK
jgi:uncharacterized protein YbaR (Trm112 family)